MRMSFLQAGYHVCVVDTVLIPATLARFIYDEISWVFNDITSNFVQLTSICFDKWKF